MAYNEVLAKRIANLVKGKKGFTTKQMFGGLSYLLNGNMCVGVHKDDLLVRFDPKIQEQVLKEKHVQLFDISGKPMKGWILVSPEGTKGKGLEHWFDVAFSYASKLPKK